MAKKQTTLNKKSKSIRNKFLLDTNGEGWTRYRTRKQVSKRIYNRAKSKRSWD